MVGSTTTLGLEAGKEEGAMPESRVHTLVQLVMVPLRTGKHCLSSGSSRIKIVIMGCLLSVSITVSLGISCMVVKS